MTTLESHKFGAAASLVLAAYAVLLAANISFAVGGSDSSGYANTAKLLSRGQVISRVQPLDRFNLSDDFFHAFVPLGFVPGPERRTMAPFYPAGLPLQMAASSLLVGWEYGPFIVSPLAALGCLVVTFLLGRELGLSHLMSFGAAAILGVSAVFLYQAVQPMSDIAATFWCSAAVLAALHSRRQGTWSVAAGAAFGMAILIRPTAAVLFPTLLLALPLGGRHLLGFAAGGAPLAAAFFAYNNAAYGNPFLTGYGTWLLDAFALAYFPTRFLHYGEWLVRMLSPLVPLGWVVLPFLRGVSLRTRALFLCWFAAFFLLSCFYEPYNTWWYSRFLLPGFPALILGAVVAADELIPRATTSAPRRRGIALLLVATALAVAVRQTKALSALDINEEQAVIPEACLWAQAALPAYALVVSVELSGALLYYTDLTPVRWDALRPSMRRRLRARTERAGAYWYALLLPHEVPLAQERYPGTWRYLGERGPLSLWRLH